MTPAGNCADFVPPNRSMSAPADSVLTLRDLEGWHFAGTALAVLGHPVGHSLSPRMHNAALAALAGRDSQYATWRYFRFDIDPADLGRALPLFHTRGFHGLNLTVPHKVIAVPLLRKIDPAARAAGATNTLVRQPEGWQGHNTDGYGLASALRETLGLELRGANVLLLGAGGAARGAAVECLQGGCASLSIANRTPKNLGALLRALAPLAGKVPMTAFDPLKLPAGALVVNATSSGLKPDDPMPVDLALLPTPAAVFDMIYNPPETPLLRQARSLGIPAANGLAMLVHQGAKALEHWTGIPATRHAPVMAAALQEQSLP
jgi:shikimate dehydrogenase